jgi:hypothetical protein
MARLPVSRWTAGWLFAIATVGVGAAYWGSTRVEGTDAFRSALVGAVVGGAFTLLGGLAGAIYVGAKDDERERRRNHRNLIGAIREVRGELINLVAATKTFNDYRDEHGQAAALAIVDAVSAQPALVASRYATHSFTLARNLPVAARPVIETAYERVAFLLQSLAYAAADHDLSNETMETVNQTRDDCQKALASLTGYLEDLGEHV